MWVNFQESQPNIVKMLKNSIVKGRVAHAYLFSGGRGTRKKDISIQFAKSLFCKHLEEAEPCLQCSDCKRIASGNHPDIHFIEPDGLSIKIDQIRSLQKEFSKTSVESGKKFYIINHADKMTIQASNSLLKFLEEPNPFTTAVLITENIHQILPTIVSRCQSLSFQPISSDHLIEQLQSESITPHLAKVAAALTNNFEEALVMVKDDWFAQARNIVIKLNESLHERPDQILLMIQDKWLTHFQEKLQIDTGLNIMLLWYKDLLHLQIGEENKIVFQDQIELLRKQSVHYSQQRVANSMTAILDAKRRLSANMNFQLLMEQLVLRLQEG